MSRDRDVRNAIASALELTGAFDDVTLRGLPEVAREGASYNAIATIDPDSSTQEDRWDSAETGAVIVTSRVMITLAARNNDPQLRDEAVEDLFDIAADALNGQSLAGFTSPELTRFVAWRWLPATQPERRIAATFSYTYLVSSWTSYDTTT